MKNKPMYLVNNPEAEQGHKHHNAALMALFGELEFRLDQMIKKSENLDQFDSPNLVGKDFFERGYRKCLRDLLQYKPKKEKER